MFGVICFIGASTVYGSGDAEGVGWVQRFKLWYRHQPGASCVYNLGIPGSNTAAMRERAEAEFGPRRPGLVVLSPGINDVPRRDEEDIQAPRLGRDASAGNIGAIVRAARTHTDKVLYLAPFTVDFKRRGIDPGLCRSYIDSHIRAARSEGAMVEAADDWLGTGKLPSLLADDGLHLNARGHDELALGMRRWCGEQR
jgi:lysophospholipase L1-like esterase